MQKWHISDTWNLYFPIQSQFRVNNRWCSSLFLFLFPQTFVFFSVMLNCIRGKLNFLFWEFLGYKISLFPISPLPWNLTPSKVTTNIKSLHHSLFCQTFQLSKQNTSKSVQGPRKYFATIHVCSNIESTPLYCRQLLQFRSRWLLGGLMWCSRVILHDINIIWHITW